MDLAKFCQELSALYQEMGDTFSQGQARSGFHCPPGCGQCCQVPTVEATLLEMLPMAWELFQQGRAEQMLRELETADLSHCVMFEAHSPDRKQGRCGLYAQRPTVCRTFGVAAVRKKDGSPELSVCRHLKEEYPSKLSQLTSPPAEWMIPLLPEWSMKLMQIHPDLLREYGPISVMLRKALEKVLFIQSLESHNTLE